MLNFEVGFSVSPYILLLIIPALFFTFFLYFRLGKRIRKQGNRIIALILHSFVMIFAIFALSGIYFSWEEENLENELVILTDASYTSEYAKERSDAFIKEVLEANNGRSKVAIVKFGYDHVLALGMGDHSPESAYEIYSQAADPDTTATDICSALTYVWDPYKNISGGEEGAIIENPLMARILLISDGLQTDRDAMSVAKLISLDGIRLDTAFYPTNPGSDAWIVGANFPDRKYGVGEEFNMELLVRSTFSGTIDFTLNDNGRDTYSGSGNVETGLKTISFPYTFTSPGHHELKFAITCAEDKLADNNVYFSYYDLEIDSSLLVVEKYPGEAQEVLGLIKNRPDALTLTVDEANVEKFTKMTIEDLRMYDEIILVNVANSDMTEEFVEILEEYVNKRGGGLFTIGGAEKDEAGNVVMTKNAEGETVPLPHAYNAEDMKGSLYHAMLPVEISAYTPPAAIAMIIDRSGSMRDSLKLDTAIPLAIASLDALSPRDYVGVIALNDWFDDAASLTPMTRRGEIENSIRYIASQNGGGTNFTLTIEHACKALCTMSVERRHIIFFTDGEPGESNDNDFVNVMKEYNEKFGITITVVLLDDSNTSNVSNLAEAGGGEVFQLTRADLNRIPTILKDALDIKELSGAMVEEYSPELGTRNPVVEGITQKQLNEITMKGVYASKLKSTKNAVGPLTTERGPLYAQWTYGNGKVGSFMCDLCNYFSENLLLSDVGRKIVNNMISTLMPLMDVKTRSLDAEFIEDNYHTQASVFGYSGKESENKLIAFVKAPDSAGGAVEKFDLSDLSTSGNRFTFENRGIGIHEVTIMEVPKTFDISRNSVASPNDVPEQAIAAILKTYRVFSYSEEYDPTKDPYAEGKELLIDISSRTDAEGEEKLIKDPDTLLLSLIRLEKSFDPRLLLILLTVVLFILEIAFRKFKFDFLKRYFSSSGKTIREMRKSDKS